MVRNRILRAVSGLITAVMVMTLFGGLSAGALNFMPMTYDTNGKLKEVELYSESIYMVNLGTDEVIISMEADEERPMASLTKIMTAIVLMDQVGKDKDTLQSIYVHAGTEAYDELYGTGASTADIQPNEDVSYYDLLAALLIASACEAANIIAINAGGSTSGFVSLMNEKAESLGLEHTHFNNAHGLFTQGNYTTAREMAELCRYALDNYSVFKELVSLESYVMGPTDYHPDGTYISNTNYMLNSYTDYHYNGCMGIKTGTTEAAGRCLASYAEYDGTSYLIVSLGAPVFKREEDVQKGLDDPTSLWADDIVYYNMLDHIHLYEWAFNMLVQTDFINEYSEVRDVPVKYGKKLDYANLKPANGYSQMWPVNVSVDEVEKVITVKENIVAPVEEGDVLGKMELRYNGETLAEIDLISTTKVERSPYKEKVKVVKSYFSSNLFKWSLFIVIMGLIIYSVVFFILAQRKYLRKKDTK